MYLCVCMDAEVRKDVASSIGKISLFPILSCHVAFVRLYSSILNFTLLCKRKRNHSSHYIGVIVGAMVSQIIGISMICSTVCSGADQRNHQSSASLAFVNSSVTNEFPSQRASNAENVYIDDVTTARETRSNECISVDCIMPARNLTPSMLGHLQICSNHNVCVLHWFWYLTHWPLADLNTILTM